MLFLPYRKINRIFLSLHVTVKAKLKAKFVYSLADRRLSVSRDKGQPSRFQNKFYATLNLHSNLSKHIPEIERQSYTLYREKSTHASTKT